MPLFGKLDVSATLEMLRIQSAWLNDLTHFLLASDVRIGVLATILLYLWLGNKGTIASNEVPITRSIAAIVLSMFACFVLRHVAPRQIRPRLAMPWLEFPPLEGLGHLADFRSFPSDTATLAAAVTVVIFMLHRRLGFVALAWTVVCVMFPRLYVGYHYLSDLLFGALVGATVTLLVMRWPLSVNRLAGVLEGWRIRQPAAATLAVILMAHQIGTVFPVLQWAAALVKTQVSEARTALTPAGQPSGTGARTDKAAPALPSESAASSPGSDATRPLPQLSSEAR